MILLKRKQSHLNFVRSNYRDIHAWYLVTVKCDYVLLMCYYTKYLYMSIAISLLASSLLYSYIPRRQFTKDILKCMHGLFPGHYIANKLITTYGGKL